MESCDKSWRRRLCYADHRFRTFLTRRGSRGNISCTIRHTGGKGSLVTGARRLSSGSWLRGEAVSSARTARRRRDRRKAGGGRNRLRGAVRLSEQRRLPCGRAERPCAKQAVPVREN